MEQSARIADQTRADRRPGAPIGNTNARKHGFYTADALELRALMRLQLRIAELGNAYVQFSAAVVAMLDGEPDADRRWKRAQGAVDSRAAALSRAWSAMRRLFVEHGRAQEARDLDAELAAVIEPS